MKTSALTFEPVPLEGRPPFVDLQPYIDGDLSQELPTVAEVGLPVPLLYAGRINEIHGEPGIGKTNVAIGAIIAVLEQGGRVLYIDPEDGPKGFVKRFSLMNGPLHLLNTQLDFLPDPVPADWDSTIKWAVHHPYTLTVLDGLADPMAAANLNEDIAGDVLTFFRERLRPLAESGSAVLVNDHVSKGTQTRNGWSRGSGAKLGRYDGIVFEIELGEAYRLHQAGHVRLKIIKDRNGGVGCKGERYAEVHFLPDEDKTRISFRKTEEGPWKPTKIMASVVEFLRSEGRVCKTRVTDGVPGKKDTILQAIRELTDEGRIHVEVVGKTHFLELIGEEK
jgi:hypothetical protein